MTHDEAADQLADELQARAVEPLASLLGVDLAEVLGRRAASAAPRLIAELIDEETCGDVAADILAALWSAGNPDPGWWRTPLGRLVAKGVADESAEAMTHAGAALMLGMARGSINALLASGELDRHPDGGVLKSSVLHRIARR